MNEIAQSIDRLGVTLKKALTQPEVVISPLDGMDISSGMLGWVRVEKALEEIQAFKKGKGNRLIAKHEALAERLIKILMEYTP